jgi:hypothetical protein
LCDTNKAKQIFRKNILSKWGSRAIFLAKINLLLKKILLRRGIASDKEKINKNKNEA